MRHYFLQNQRTRGSKMSRTVDDGEVLGDAERTSPGLSDTDRISVWRNPTSET
jgi:hypothetical protein